MTKEELIRIGTLMGLKFNESTNFPDALEKGTVVFDGCNGQRFLIESSGSDDYIFGELGNSLFLLGKRTKCLEISNVLSINNDFED